MRVAPITEVRRCLLAFGSTRTRSATHASVHQIPALSSGTKRVDCSLNPWKCLRQSKSNFAHGAPSDQIQADRVRLRVESLFHKVTACNR
jgi:hypothetical protein